MIARHESAPAERNDIWAQLSARLPADTIAWRQDGRPTQREGKYFARFVAYVEAGTVRERLDAVIPGEWDLTLDLLPAPHIDDADDAVCAFKARLQILGVIREDVGNGKDYKQAATDSFKRAAVRFGIGHELYDMEPLWVQVDGDGKYAKALEDPATVYARKAGKASEGEQRARPTPSRNGTDAAPSTPPSATAPTTNTSNAPRATTTTNAAEVEPDCPTCGGRMFDNRLTKKNPKAPDYRCRSRTCEGVIWPMRAPRTEPTDYDESVGS